MALLEYDRVLVEKLQRWIPSELGFRVLGPDETKRLFETMADDSNDKKVKLPIFALSRSKDIELSLNVKNERSFRGLVLDNTSDKTVVLNVIPIDLNYTFDIYSKTYEEGCTYLREFVFKLINNPKMVIDIDYEGVKLQHTVYIRTGSTLSDTSDISQHLFPGQFTRWTIQLSLQDAYLWSVQGKSNWSLVPDGVSKDASGIEPVSAATVTPTANSTLSGHIVKVNNY